jgi:hypothetical protein
MDELQAFVGRDDAEGLYRALLDRLGLGGVTCSACARVLLPPPLNWESYTFTTTSGRSWTWDIQCARALVAARAVTEPLLLEPSDVQEWLANHGLVDVGHLAHIPPDRIDDPVLLATVPDGQGQVMIDGSHRATIRVRSGRAVEGLLLTPVESALAIDVVPLAIQRLAMELRRRRLL